MLKSALAKAGFVGCSSSPLSPSELKDARERIRSLRRERANKLPSGEGYVQRAARKGVSVDVRVAERVARWRVEKTLRGLI